LAITQAKQSENTHKYPCVYDVFVKARYKNSNLVICLMIAPHAILRQAQDDSPLCLR